MLKSFRYLLFPFSLIYGAVIWLRNFLFDKKIFKSAKFNFPIICVGNLAVGGTGKTPMTEYLIELLQSTYSTATLSRGYKRKTKGFAIANATTTALEIGDEPMQFHEKYPAVTVAVGEERFEAIPQILHARPATQVIILDDAFQHRSVQAGLNILLTEYKNLYSSDLMMPVGDLRDITASSKRAEIIVVTKCRSELSLADKKEIEKELNALPNQKIFFTEILYAAPYHLFTKQLYDISDGTDLLLVTGIANPKPMKSFLAEHVNSSDMLRYPDHHIFSSTDLRDIKKQFEKIKSSDKIILTTEKDAVRLKKFEKELSNLPIYALPIRHHFLFNEEENFNNIVSNFVKGFA
ncbi:MAG: tetraacyldisaccharide 4'-kinase [Ferruginibacter sp.]|nr:tetraacyldisaccharide 4'-kinase [Ferruginibacter sp.]